MNRTRREAIRRLGLLLAGSPLFAAQQGSRIPALDELVNVFEVEGVARVKLSRALYDHIAAGTGAEVTLRRNREAFDRITFRPRMLVDVREMDLSTKLFGQKLEVPILVGPTSGHQLLHPQGELATVHGAGAARAVMVVSGRPSVAIDRIAEKAKAPLWCQLDADGEAGRMKESVQRALDAGSKAICLTGGAPYEPVGAGSPPHPSRLVSRANPRLSWAILEQFRAWTTVPVLIKGIMSPEEARISVDRGAQGIIVSNYGGRYADGAPSTIEVLPAIAEAVGGRVPVLIDGGFRRGTDVLKALALGAKAVLLGRPPLWGLAAYGAEGVQKVLEMLQTELALAMGLSGKPNLASVDRTLVKIHRW